MTLLLLPNVSLAANYFVTPGPYSKEGPYKIIVDGKVIESPLPRLLVNDNTVITEAVLLDTIKALGLVPRWGADRKAIVITSNATTSSWSGTWNSSFGTMVLVQNGNS